MRLAFACPFYGPTPPLISRQQRSNIMNAAQDGHVWEDDYSTWGFQHRYACEQIAQQAAKDDRIDGVFWTEHDVVLPNDAVQLLVKALDEKPEADVISGIVFRRCEPYNPMISLAGNLTEPQYEQMRADIGSGKLADPRLKLAFSVLPYEEMAKNWLAPLTEVSITAPPAECVSASMGCLLFRRKVFQEMQDVKDLFAIDAYGLWSIDTAFFLRVRDAGLKLYYTPKILCGHKDDSGEIIGINHYQRYLMQLAEKGEEARTEQIRREHPEARIYGELTRLANKYGTDKGTLDHQPGSGWEGWIHNYTPFYEAVLAPMRLRATRVLEIGVFYGASLKMWRDYFPNAVVHGIDNWSLEPDAAPKPENLGERIYLHQADQANREDLQAFLQQEPGEFDLICDDGGHMMEQQQASLGFLFPSLRPGGIYIVEDLHTSAMGAEYGVKPDGSNATLHFLEALQEGRECPSEYMTEQEYAYLRERTDSVMIHGKKSMTAVIRKRS